MITENYVSFETAKLLKEKGFDAECDYLYVDGKLVRAQGCACNWNDGETLFSDYKNECSAPSLQMVMKWLREAHRLFIFVSPWIMLENNIQYYFEIRDIKTRDFETLYDYTSKELNSFEKVTEAAIKYCLENLI